MSKEDRICDRCHKQALGMIMSMLNTEEICMECKAKELNHPRYHEAHEAERREVAAGNYNYPGLLAGEKITYDE